MIKCILVTERHSVPPSPSSLLCQNCDTYDCRVTETFISGRTSVGHLVQALALKSGITPKWVFNRPFWEVLALPVLHERSLLCSQWLHAVAKAVFENKSDSVGSPLAELLMRKKINVNQSILSIGLRLCWISFRRKLYWEMWRVSGKVMVPALSSSGNSWRE